MMSWMITPLGWILDLLYASRGTTLLYTWCEFAVKNPASSWFIIRATDVYSKRFGLLSNLLDINLRLHVQHDKCKSHTRIYTTQGIRIPNCKPCCMETCAFCFFLWFQPADHWQPGRWIKARSCFYNMSFVFIGHPQQADWHHFHSTPIGGFSTSSAVMHSV